MLYDLDNPMQRQQFLDRAASLARKGGTAELRSRQHRTPRQNRYLHLILGWFAFNYGEDPEYVKYHFFKRTVNPDIFLVTRHNSLRGSYQSLRSTTELSTEQLSLAIDRFRDYSAKEADIYLPTPDDLALIRQIEIELDRQKILSAS